MGADTCMSVLSPSSHLAMEAIAFQLSVCHSPRKSHCNVLQHHQDIHLTCSHGNLYNTDRNSLPDCSHVLPVACQSVCTHLQGRVFREHCLLLCAFPLNLFLQLQSSAGQRCAKCLAGKHLSKPPSNFLFVSLQV